MLKMIRTQYAALPYRIHEDERPEVLLITSRGTGRWILPKGWPMFGRRPWYAAARESTSEIGTLKRAFVDAGGRWSTFVIWSKSHFTFGRSDYQHQYEPILYGWPEGNRHYWCGARDQGDVWAYEKPRSNDLHPTMKPVALVERALRNSSKGRDTILDPFAGSGTTLMAAEATGRRAGLIELDHRYCDVIVRRWQEGTDQVATLGENGRSFDEVAAERGVAADGPHRAALGPQEARGVRGRRRRGKPPPSRCRAAGGLSRGT